jgi:hypothetical protein
MADDPFDLRDTWQIPPPYYLRKVDAASHWGTAKDDVDSRIDTALAKVFAPDEGRISVYCIQRRDDLRRVVVALDANRQFPGNAIRFLAISPDELRPFSLDTTPGATKCREANRLHNDIVVMDRMYRLRELVMAMIAADRTVRNFSKKALAVGLTLADGDFCNARSPSFGCACDRRPDRWAAYWMCRGLRFLVPTRKRP